MHTHTHNTCNALFASPLIWIQHHKPVLGWLVVYWQVLAEAWGKHWWGWEEGLSLNIVLTCRKRNSSELHERERISQTCIIHYAGVLTTIGGQNTHLFELALSMFSSELVNGWQHRSMTWYVKKNKCRIPLLIHSNYKNRRFLPTLFHCYVILLRLDDWPIKVSFRQLEMWSFFFFVASCSAHFDVRW